MQALSILLPNKFPDSKHFPPFSAKSDQHFSSKLKVDHEEEKFEEEQEFSFACATPQGPHIFADEIFQNRQIQSVFHVSNQSIDFVDGNKNRVTMPLQPPLKKLFVEQRNCISSKLDCTSEESYCEWSEKDTMLEVDTSKLWRFRKDLKPSIPTSTKPMTVHGVRVKNVTKKKTKDGKHKTTLSALEKLYVKRRMVKESHKRRSFLPYKQNLVGFFANANRFSRNLHPF